MWQLCALKVGENMSTSLGVFCRIMMLEAWQSKMLRKRLELVIFQIWKSLLGESTGVYVLRRNSKVEMSGERLEYLFVEHAMANNQQVE